LTAIRPAHDLARSRERRVVTAYVGNLFDWIFGEDIQTVGPTDDFYDADIISDDDIDVEDLLIPKPKEPAPAKFYGFHHGEYRKAVYPRYTTSKGGKVAVGDVVELSRDIDTHWKKSTQKWYAFVTDRWKTPKGAERIKIIWLYWPEDVALCMSMKYPYPNEVRICISNCSYSLVIIVNVERQLVLRKLCGKSRWNSFASMPNLKILVLHIPSQLM
jgi:hypothetical protein